MTRSNKAERVKRTRFILCEENPVLQSLGARVRVEGGGGGHANEKNVFHMKQLLRGTVGYVFKIPDLGCWLVCSLGCAQI